MLKKTILLLALLQIGFLYAQNSRLFDVNNIVRVNKTNCQDLSRLSVIIPCPLTNQYQTVSELELYGGELLSVQNDINKYVRFYTTTPALDTLCDSMDFMVRFIVAINQYFFDFSQVDTIFPYNTSSSEYIKYTSNSGSYIVCNNVIINDIADSIWGISEDLIDYARKCYGYVSTHYQYLNPLTGVRPLAEILANGGGDCGNLSSIYVSLLRNKGIPSRHVQTVRPNRTYHVWTEFFLENYGWIPVDVTFKLLHPENDYFGRYSDNGIVVTRGLYFQVANTPTSYATCVLLQNYKMWYWGVTGGICNNVIGKHIMNSEERFCVNVRRNNEGWGVTEGEGCFSLGDTAILNAIPSYGYSFDSWSLQDSVLSTDATLFVPVVGNIEVDANFERQHFSVKAKTEPENSGVIAGSGDYLFGDTVSLSIEPFQDYVFVSWTENGSVFSSSSSVSIIVDRDRFLIAELEEYNNIIESTYDVDIYPNPTKSLVTVKGQGLGRIRVFSKSGQLIKEELINGRQEINIDLSRMEPSIYLLQILSDEMPTLHKKLIIL